MSTLSPFPFSDFGGLDLTSDPDESGCIDMLNVDLDKRGSVRSRDGYTKLNAVANPVSFEPGSLAIWQSQNLFIGSGIDKKLYVYNSTGVIQYTSGAYTEAVLSATPFGTGTTSYFYLAQAGGGIIRLTTAGVFSTPAGMPLAVFVTVQPLNNRLVAANLSGHTSRVQFSDPGDAETWGTNNYVDLTPNDGEVVVAPVAWRNSVFVFKQTKFFEFYGNSIDAQGNPVFNYRVVDTGIGAINAVGPAVATPDGVYFFSSRGIYRTTGGPPQKVSDSLDPLFTGASTPFGTLVSPLLSGSFRGSAYVAGRVYFATADANGVQYVLVYEIATQHWCVWRFAATVVGVAGYNDQVNPGQDRLAFTGGSRIYTQHRTDTTDDGTAITSRYRSGFTALNWARRSGRWYPITSQEATVRETILDGTGSIKYSLSRDFGAVPTTGGGAKATVTLGTSPAIAQGRHTVSQQGRRVSFQIEDNSGSAWRILGLTMHIEDARYPGMETS